MRVLEKFQLMEEVVNRIIALDPRIGSDFLDALERPIIEITSGTTLKDLVNARLKNISDEDLIKIAKYELEMDLSKFKSIPNDDDDDLIPF